MNKLMNLVILVIDALRQDGLTKSEQLKRFAKNASAIFPNTISASSISVPSFASIHTGLYPPAHGLRYQKSGALGQVPTLAGKMVDKGFRTMACAYTVAVSPLRRTNRGFQEYINLNRTSGALFGQQYWNNMCEWWEKKRNEPSYLFLHTLACHSPYDGKNFTSWDTHAEVKKRINALPREEYIQKYWNAVDEVFQFLVEPMIDYILSIRPDTRIFILSDHGELLLDAPNEWSLATPGTWIPHIINFVRGKKSLISHGNSLEDMLVKVPLITINTPQINSSDKIKRTVDIVPTIMELIGEDSSGFNGYTLTNEFAPEIAYAELMDRKIFRITTPMETHVMRYGDKIPQKFESFMKGIKEITQTKLGEEEEKEVKKRLRELGYL